MATLELRKRVQTKRTALYFSVEQYAPFEKFAEEKGVSFNRAAIYLMQLGMEALNESGKRDEV
jgi:hypothetical protein